MNYTIIFKQKKVGKNVKCEHSNVVIDVAYRKLPIIRGALTFEISSPMGRFF